MITRPKLLALVVHSQHPTTDGAAAGAGTLRHFVGGVIYVQHVDRLPRRNSATAEALLRDEIDEAPQAKMVTA
ncbi:hypothetical protein [Stenotrophomonas sp. 278]|uniref:hypothetical protein n=1 Tax=Stenotrophomonas sp. 278 TaxID=2479851 RepID=UPI000F6703C2|nr:hypothetical protein [Stenotrophomonas sp. 278]RRT95411.1 hypothetical protein EGJ34_21975 [Stenotrophomonas sp. 278]